jgi:hypothetical protein
MLQPYKYVSEISEILTENDTAKWERDLQTQVSRQGKFIKFNNTVYCISYITKILDGKHIFLQLYFLMNEENTCKKIQQDINGRIFSVNGSTCL